MIPIATQVYKDETLVLQDGTEVRIRPLPIKHLRKFMAEVGKLSELDAENVQDKSLEVMFDATVVALEKDNPEVAKDRDKLEETLDVPTMHKIFDIAGGVKLSGDDLPN